MTEPQRGEGSETPTYDPQEHGQIYLSQNDEFDCEGTGIGSLLRKIGSGLTNKKSSQHSSGDADDQVIGIESVGGEVDFTTLMVFEEELDERIGIEAKKQQGGGWVGNVQVFSKDSPWGSLLAQTDEQKERSRKIKKRRRLRKMGLLKNDRKEKRLY